MLAIRPSDARGVTKISWLDSRHTFSFGDYRDPRHVAFGPLRVINEDWVAPGGGFATHGHSDMEIVTWVLEGALAHKDSLGNGSVIRPGEVQRMSAGTGIEHSEFNHSQTAPVHLLQIWLHPREQGLAPSYEQKAIPPADMESRLCLIAARDGRGGAVTIHQDADIYAARLGAGEAVRHPLAAGRRAWVQVARGAVTVNGSALAAGDGAALAQEAEAAVTGTASSEILLFDLP